MGWRRQYIILLAIRLYLALQPSYIHPDEHFQGPEVIAGEIFNWPTLQTWEFTSEKPIRSFFPLWFIYGIPMQVLDWIMPGTAPPRPIVTFYVLRILAFLASFMLEDWALQDLASSPRSRKRNLLFLASSYVTWTYQTHTLSNATETITLLGALVLIERITKSRANAFMPSFLFGLIAVFGVFNRITFPCYLLLPVMRLVPHFIRHPWSFVTILLSASITTVYAIYLDTLFYNPSADFKGVFLLRNISPVITPLNNILYNTRTSNLAQHGLHPRYTHFLANLPQLLGPAFVSILLSPSKRLLTSTPFLSAVSGVTILSFMPHQEARFLIPAIPLLLTVTPLPRASLSKNLWLGAWVGFNAIFGVFMGMYHQAGIVPAQNWLATNTNATQIVFWKTYPPPSWLLGERNLQTNLTDLMGTPINELMAVLDDVADCGEEHVVAEGDGTSEKSEAYLVAPVSAVKLDPLVNNPSLPWRLEEMHTFKKHLNMDDLDIPEEGVIGTWRRVVGRRGLRIWRVRKRRCDV